LNLIIVSVQIVRRHDVALPSISATVFTTPKPHELTIVELRVSYTRYPTGSTYRYSPTAIIKWNLLPGTADTKAPFPSKLGIIIVLVPLLASLATFPLEHLSQLLHSFPSKPFSVFISDVKEKLRVDRKQKSIQAATHDSVFRRA
jgi:hypothetical protein